MKTFGLAVLAAIGGSVKAAMTGAFVIGPLMAVTAVIMVLVVRARRSY